MSLKALVMLALIGCAEIKGVTEVGGGLGLDFGYGSVWECEVEDAYAGHVIVDLEYCWKGAQDDLESTLWVAYGNEDGEGFATCRHTERHAGPCYWCCGANCPSTGANALNGNWCPK